MNKIMVASDRATTAGGLKKCKHFDDKTKKKPVA